MKTNHPEPDEARLHDLLRESRPAPPLPPRFQEAVWRRIERTEAPVTQSFWPFAGLERWVERLLLPRFAFASLALLLVAGGVTGVIASAAAAREQAQARYLSAVAPHHVR